MRFLASSLLLSAALASPLVERAAKPVYWLLAGDSTTKSVGGWGGAFLRTTVAPGSSGMNYAHSGRTTRSFRNSGEWAQIINDIGKQKSKYDVYVTIQFGHNDQKSGSGVSLDQYRANLLAFAREASSAGAQPILVTPLTRRDFDSNGKVKANLSTQRQITMSVAQDNNIKWIDLNKASETYVNAIGKAATLPYNYNGGKDKTHLSPWGEVVFGRMVSDLLVEKYPSNFKAFTKPNATMSALIKAGKPA